MEMAKHIPDGWPALIPRIAVEDPEALVSFILDVFGATGEFHRERPSELRIGDSLLMVGSAFERNPITAFLYIYVEDTDATYQRALDASSLEEPRQMASGHRRAMIRDPWITSVLVQKPNTTWALGAARK